MPFVGSVIVEQVDNKMWRVHRPISYKARWDEFEIPRDFITDFASVPRLVVWLIPSYGAYTRAAILHDWLLVSQLVSREDADGIFRRAMRELGVGTLRRWMMWCAVRAAGLMSGASPMAWLIWIPLSLFSLIFVAIPAIIVQVWLLVFWLLETLVYVYESVFSRRTPVPPAASPYSSG